MSEEKVYQAIYEAVDGDKYLYLDGENYYCYARGIWDKSSEEDNHANDKNITHEYLQNTYGEVQSHEHAELIIKLASKAGFFIACGYSSSIKFFCTNNESLVFCRVEQNAKRERKQITIPLPPKSESNKWTPDSYDLDKPPKHFDCMCNKCGGKCCTGQCDKFPQVGDEVEFPSGKGTLVVRKPDDQGIVIVESFDSELGSAYKRVSLKALKKPKTPEEELRDDIAWLTIKHMENKSHSTEDNAYYLFSDLMGKYNITKKV